MEHQQHTRAVKIGQITIFLSVSGHRSKNQEVTSASLLLLGLRKSVGQSVDGWMELNLCICDCLCIKGCVFIRGLYHYYSGHNFVDNCRPFELVPFKRRLDNQFVQKFGILFGTKVVPL